MKLSFRLLFISGFSLCVLLLASAYFMEYVLGLEPCPLCIFQRFAFYGMGFFFLLGAIHNCQSFGRYIYAFHTSLFSLIGIGLASRQVWLQHLPPEALPSCTASLDRLMTLYPILDVLKIVLEGSPECTENDFTILYLTLPEWTLLTFIALLIYSIGIMVGQKKRWI